MEVNYERRLTSLACWMPPPAGPTVESCFELRNSMPKAGDGQTFGRLGADVDVTLPYSIVRGNVALVLPKRATLRNSRLTLI